MVPAAASPRPSGRSMRSGLSGSPEGPVSSASRPMDAEGDTGEIPAFGGPGESPPPEAPKGSPRAGTSPNAGMMLPMQPLPIQVPAERGESRPVATAALPNTAALGPATGSPNKGGPETPQAWDLSKMTPDGSASPVKTSASPMTALPIGQRDLSRGSTIANSGAPEMVPHGHVNSDSIAKEGTLRRCTSKSPFWVSTEALTPQGGAAGVASWGVGLGVTACLSDVIDAGDQQEFVIMEDDLTTVHIQSWEQKLDWRSFLSEAVASTRARQLFQAFDTEADPPPFQRPPPSSVLLAGKFRDRGWTKTPHCVAPAGAGFSPISVASAAEVLGLPLPKPLLGPQGGYKVDSVPACEQPPPGKGLEADPVVSAADAAAGGGAAGAAVAANPSEDATQDTDVSPVASTPASKTTLEAADAAGLRLEAAAADVAAVGPLSPTSSAQPSVSRSLVSPARNVKGAMRSDGAEASTASAANAACAAAADPTGVAAGAGAGPAKEEPEVGPPHIE